MVYSISCCILLEFMSNSILRYGIKCLYFKYFQMFLIYISDVFKHRNYFYNLLCPSVRRSVAKAYYFFLLLKNKSFNRKIQSMCLHFTKSFILSGGQLSMACSKIIMYRYTSLFMGLFSRKGIVHPMQ